MCTNSREVVDHQRLAGSGYCFSASLPPFLCATAQAALEQMRDHPEVLTQLRDNTHSLHAALQDVAGLQVESNKDSPIIHLRFTGERAKLPTEAQEVLLDELKELVLEHGVLVCRNYYLRDEVASAPKPSLRLMSNALLTADDIATIVRGLQQGMGQLRATVDVDEVTPAGVGSTAGRGVARRR